ncbi:MAG TPA: hypothetical protein VEW48_06360 [Thermoanaerobaculia bacterium]|nr:hypothetical protein [Thermoanaerobaculia bacterium]
MLRKLMIHSVFCGLVVAAAPSAVHAACPAGFVELDLKTGVATISAPLAPYFSYVNAGAPAAVPATAACPAAAGWKKAALKIVIPGAPNTCTQANIVVEYEGLPSAWSVDLGDSPTNDGFAGDGGTTDHDAELWILNENLALANGGTNPNNPQVFQHLALTDGAIKFAVKNQFVSWGQPYNFAQAPASQDLFAIPDTTVPAADQRAIYLGLNRVISNRLDRTGCGARRVLITFQ